MLFEKHLTIVFYKSYPDDDGDILHYNVLQNTLLFALIYVYEVLY